MSIWYGCFFASLALAFFRGQKRILIRTILFLILFYIIFLLCLVSGITADYHKAQMFTIAVIVFGILLSCVLDDPDFLELMPITLALVGMIAIIGLIGSPTSYSSDRVSIGSANPIWAARALGLFGISGVYWAVFKQRFSLATVAMVCASLAAITITGSRGPFLGLCATLTYAILFLMKKKRHSRVIAVVYAGAFIILVIYSYDFVPNLRIFSGESMNSGFSRIEIYKYALSLIWMFPRGIGIGYFHYYQFSYPHNIILEIMVEWGWFIGAIILLLILLGSFRLLISPPKYNVLKLILIYELFNACVSGDITSPRMLYALILIGLFPARPKMSRYVPGVRDL